MEEINSDCQILENKKKQLEKIISKISNTNATILITGESGTGKSLLAKKIHSRSDRTNQQFIELHCTTIPENLIESELFGHVKGSFTGASKDKIGKVELANNGTLFIDEIGDLSLSGQAKLLRLLQEKIINRVGSNKDLKIDTRIILATHRNLKKMVENGTFREDLYYRINIFECSLLPLRHRKDEIICIASNIIKEFSLKHNTKKFYLGDKLKKIFLEYSWPGNIRELKNCLDRLCYLASSEELSVEDLPSKIINSGVKAQKIESKDIPLIQTAKNGPLSLEELEKKYISLILNNEKCYDKAAKILGITTVTLWRKRRTFQI